jgi:MFS family permease
MINFLKSKSKGKSDILYIVTLLNDAALNVLIFTVARGLAEQNSSLLVMGIFGAGISLFFAFSSLGFGRVSDKMQHKKLLMYLGVILLLVCTALIKFLDIGSTASMIIYGLAGGSAGLLYPALLSWLNHKAPGKTDVKGISSIVMKFCISWNLGMIMGNYAAGKFYSISSDLPLYLGVGFCLVNLLLLYAVLPSHPALNSEPAASVPSAALHPQILSINPAQETQDQLRKNLFVKLSWVANIGGAFISSLILHLFPKMAVEIGISPEQHAIILGIMRAAVISIYLIMHSSTFWHYKFPVLLSLQGVAIMGLILLYSSQNVFVIIFGFICIACLTGHNYFAGMFYGNATSSNENSGKLNGYHEGTIGLGVGLGSLVGGIVGYYYSLYAPYLFAVIVICIMVSIQLVMYIRYLMQKKLGINAVIKAKESG